MSSSFMSGKLGLGERGRGLRGRGGARGGVSGAGWGQGLRGRGGARGRGLGRGGERGRGLKLPTPSWIKTKIAAFCTNQEAKKVFQGN